MVPPLVVDIDGTLTRPEGGLDPRVFDPLREWEAPVVLATGKAVPYPVALCQFVGIEERVISENGGVVLAEDRIIYDGDREGPQRVADEYVAAGYSMGWGEVDTINRWRETEIAVSRDQPLEPLERLAEEHGLAVVDTGYAYHVKELDFDKGTGVRTVADILGYEPGEFVAIGDSENDAPAFEVVGRSYAVANADERARAAADVVTAGEHAAGMLEALEEIRAG